MEENRAKNEEIEIDLKRLLGAVLSKAWLVVIVAVVCAVITFLGTVFFITPQYQSSAMFYVNNSSLTVGDASLSLSTGDISASRGLVDTYIVILDTRETLLDVIDYAGVDITYSQLREMIDAKAVNDTEVFRVTVTCPDPEDAEKLANAIAYILPKRISTIIEGTSAKVVDAAVAATDPSSPSYTKNALLGFLAGFVIVIAGIVIHALLDITIRTEEDIMQICEYPVLATVPDMNAPVKDGYYGRGPNVIRDVAAKQNELIGGGVCFAAAEAYKLLRTKVQFSFPQESGCRVIGISSALSGEGKTLSAINLAYSISLLGERVLLIEGDMRRPTLMKKLPVSRAPGLSDYLVGRVPFEAVIQMCGIKNEEKAFAVMTSGQIPPNPTELLSSSRMEMLMRNLRERYDYIILDLPPVGEVSDALSAAKLTDGMLLVARQKLCNRNVLGSMIRHFAFVDAKIIGVLFNCTTEEEAGLNRKYYKKYYKSYSKQQAGRFASDVKK